MFNRLSIITSKIILIVGLFLFMNSPAITYGQEENPTVDAFGALVYKYPIELPPGTNGMGPSLSLVYNSNSGNGMLGMGWNLTGIPVITRDPSYGINFDNNDHYLYNGEKLVKDQNGVYHTERESFVRIEAVNLNSATSYWVVSLKNGIKMYFGYPGSEHTTATDGHVDAVGKGGNARLWSLSKVIDLQGNYYVVEYNEDAVNGDYYPVRIIYTKNEIYSLQVYQKVEFFYEKRNDHYPLYNPALLDMEYRLKWITVKIDRSLLKKYRLDYEYGACTGRSRLIAIQEYGNDGDTPLNGPYVEQSYKGSGKTLPITKFSWQEGTNRLDTFSGWGRNGGDIGSARYKLGDFNGDGLTDVISFETNGGLYVWLSKLNGGFTGPSMWAQNGGDIGANRYQLGDFNGDGLIDVISFETNGGLYVWLAKPGGGFNGPSMWARNGGDIGAGRYQLGDFNGDGRTDVISFETNGGLYVWLAKPEGGFNRPSMWAQNGGDIGANRYQLGDFNGDGLTDVISFETNGGLYVWLSRPKGGFTGPSMWAQNGGDIGTNRYKLGDFNGDGLMDVISFETNGGLYVWLSKPKGGFTGPSMWAQNGGDIGANRYMLGNFNGDGLKDVISFETNGMLYVWKSIGFNSDFLNTINTSIGGTISISYKPTPLVLGAVFPSGKSYPNIANNNSSLLVTKITYDNISGEQIINSYKFSNKIFHLGFPQERINFGFTSIEKLNEKSNGSAINSQITYYRQDDIDLRGQIDRVEILGPNREKYLEKRYTYTKRNIINNSNNPIYHDVNFIYVSEENSLNYNGQSTPIEYKTLYEYDDYGNLTKTNNLGDINEPSDVQLVETQYNIDNLNWIMQPSVTRKYAPRLDGTTGLAMETRFTYNENHLLIQKDFENDDQDVSFKYSYDDYGNLTSITDGKNQTTAITYDETYKTFERTTTNPLGQTKETIYDYLMRPIKVTDANGVVWETVYDEFSREKATIAPGDTAANPTTRKSYPDEFIDTQTGKQLFPSRMKIELKESDGNYIEKYQYIDGLGRVIQEKTEAESGWITVDYYFDGVREYKTSVPYITTGFEYSTPDPNIKYKWIEFDPLGRETLIHNTDGTSVQKIYHQQETMTIDEKGHVTGKKVIGNTEYVTSYTGVYPNQTVYATTVTQKAWDKIQIIDAKGNVIEVSLDMLGRKIGFKDPDMGLWSYTYDANGNLLTQTDAKGQTLKMYYDSLNRLTKKEYPDLSATCVYYDESGHGYAKGRVTRVIYDGGGESYEYDARGRVAALTQTIDSHTKTLRKTYDSQDRVITEIYPDGEVVSFTYNRSGNLDTLIGDSPYINGIDYSPLGKVTKMRYGNGVETDYDYYDQADEYDNTALTYYSYRLKQIHVSSGANDIFKLAYEYDRAGNIKEKKDSGDEYFTESYGYDDLNRLIIAGSSAYGFKQYQYDEINNIVRKELKSYQYSVSQPHAVVNDGKFTYTYDANGNMASRSDGRIYNWDFDNKLVSLSDGGTYKYSPSGRRIEKIENGKFTLYYFAEYEEEFEGGSKTKTVKYYFANGQRVAENTNTDGLRYYHQDHLGSSLALTDINGVLIYRANYEPFGGTYYSLGDGNLKYKFTGQELDASELYYYGARYYDPMLGRFISPDSNLDGLNRYTYCHNNPVIYIDPTGEFFWLPVIIGAAFGAYEGYEIGNANGADGADLLGYVLGGAIIGGLSGYAGGAVTAAEIPMANTLGIMTSSSINSLGMYAISDGKTDLSICFGFGSYNFTQGEWNTLFDGDNQWSEDLGYFFGAMGNLTDVVSLPGGGVNVDAITQKKDVISHASVVNEAEGISISVGPAERVFIDLKSILFKTVDGKHWNNHASDGMKLPIFNVNKRILKYFSDQINKGQNFLGGELQYRVIGNSCVSYASRALWLCGVPNIGVHPYLWQTSLLLRQTGIYSSSYLGSQ